MVVIPCEGYQQYAVAEAIETGISLLGGWDCFLKKHEKILLKPNLLNRAEPNRAVTTHPAVFQSVAESLIENGYSNLCYGDSPGHPGSVEKTSSICGLHEVAEKLNLPLAEFTKSKTVEYRRGNVERKYEICEGVLESDGIINICKMKTHQLERITGGVKNMFGCVCGLNKGAAHAKYPDADSFAQMLVDLNLLLKARLHIMDGIIAMEGNGPASGNPVEMNVILMSEDPVALDATFCRLISLDPAVVATVYHGGNTGLGKWREEEIEIVGVDRLEPYSNPDFDVMRDKQSSGIWVLLNKLKALARKPVILNEKCIRCGACVEACPLQEKAVFFENSIVSEEKDRKKKSVPVYDYQKCIRCYCCQEMCPEQAIVVKRKFF